jgi:hypothetical protein
MGRTARQKREHPVTSAICVNLTRERVAAAVTVLLLEPAWRAEIDWSGAPECNPEIATNVTVHGGARHLDRWSLQDAATPADDEHRPRPGSREAIAAAPCPKPGAGCGAHQITARGRS